MRRWIYTRVEVGELRCTECISRKAFFARCNQEPPHQSDTDIDFWVETEEANGKTYRIFCRECMEELFND